MKIAQHRADSLVGGSTGDVGFQAAGHEPPAVSVREYERFVDIAVGSAVEVRYLLRLAVDLGLLTADDSQVGRERGDHVVRPQVASREPAKS